MYSFDTSVFMDWQARFSPDNMGERGTFSEDEAGVPNSLVLRLVPAKNGPRV